jgi:hypothetical protein
VPIKEYPNKHYSNDDKYGCAYPRRHAALVFDDKKNETMLLPGESAGIVYLEGDAVYAPKQLQKFARIGIGDSEFLFAPLCDETFDWKE